MHPRRRYILPGDGAQQHDMTGTERGEREREKHGKISHEQRQRDTEGKVCDTASVRWEPLVHLNWTARSQKDRPTPGLCCAPRALFRDASYKDMRRHQAMRRRRETSASWKRKSRNRARPVVPALAQVIKTSSSSSSSICSIASLMWWDAWSDTSVGEEAPRHARHVPWDPD